MASKVEEATLEDPREAVEAILEVPGWVEGPTILEECKVEEGMTGTLEEVATIEEILEAGEITGEILGEIGEAIGTGVGGTECSLKVAFPSKWSR